MVAVVAQPLLAAGSRASGSFSATSAKTNIRSTAFRADKNVCPTVQKWLVRTNLALVTSPLPAASSLTMKKQTQKWRDATIAIHAGEEKHGVGVPVAPVITRSSNFTFANVYSSGRASALRPLSGPVVARDDMSLPLTAKSYSVLCGSRGGGHVARCGEHWNGSLRWT